MSSSMSSSLRFAASTEKQAIRDLKLSTQYGIFQ